MNSLFIPKELKELKDLLNPMRPSDPDNYLIYTDYDYLYSLVDFNTNNAMKIPDYDCINNFCMHGDKFLFGNEYGQIIDLASGDVLKKYDMGIRALCSHEGDLYAATSFEAVYGDVDRNEFKVVDRPANITSLCSHKGVLYDGTGKQVSKTVSDFSVQAFEGTINDMCSFEGKMYVATSRGLLDGDGNEIYSYKSPVVSVFDYNNRLYTIGEDGFVWDVFGNNGVRELQGVERMISVPISVMDAYVDRRFRETCG